MTRREVARLPICSNGNPAHEHGRACLPRLIARLPRPPAGWSWKWGATAVGGWTIFLESPNGGAFHVVELSPAPTIGALATVVDAYIAGSEGLPF